MFSTELEPQSKKMSVGDSDAFQRWVTEEMATRNKRPFAGSIALELDLTTTRKTAPQAHTIAKNFLDLLGTRRPNVPGRGKKLLYKDDSQIQALSVACRHGETEPWIRVTGRPFSAMLEDVELASEELRSQRDMNTQMAEEYRDDEWIDSFRDMIRNEASTRRRLGDELYETSLRLSRWYAQRTLLTRSAIDIQTLATLYRLPRETWELLPRFDWTDFIRSSPLRLQLGDLPIAHGQSAAFKQNVALGIHQFKERWDWILKPLVVAVAVEVIVRPNAATPAGVLHDLDNVVRDYLLPGIIPAFGTVTDHRWTIDFADLAKRDPELAARWGPNPTPPKSTRNGVTRYEAWRLHPVEGEPGFVSVALVADIDARGSLIEQIDRLNRKWADRRRAW